MMETVEFMAGSDTSIGLHLPTVTRDFASLVTDLYGRPPVRRTLDGADWRFAWKQTATLNCAVVLQLRLGSGWVRVYVEDLSIFGAASDVSRPELPEPLRVAYLGAVGASLWRLLEEVTASSVELVRVDRVEETSADHDAIGFEVTCESRRRSTRGFVVCDRAAERVLSDAGRHEAHSRVVRVDWPVRWSAVAGTAVLTVAELHALEPEDILLIDGVSFTHEHLTAWLCAGARVRRVGRVALKLGQLHLIELHTEGTAFMLANTASDSTADTVAYGDIDVELRFELAQWTAPLGQVSTFAPGAVLDLGQPVDEAAVSVWIGARCIGKGQLVAIGERLGLRLTSVFSATSQSPRPDEQS